MSLVNIGSLSMSFGGQNVLESISSRINRGDHIGLVGPNGVGKTTLLQLICGQLDPTAGNVVRFPNLRTGYLPQHQDYPPDQTVYEEVYAGLGELSEIEAEMRRCENLMKETTDTDEKQLTKIISRYSDLTERFELHGGSSAEAKVETLLSGFGVPRRLWKSRMETLSGGERNIIGLARILIGGHDLMLLDEPGNHLDFSGLDWLERFLSETKAAFIVVSHNRYLLDKVCTQIWELERCRLKQFTGNYSDYRAEKLIKQLQQESAYHRQQKQIERLEFNIRRLKAWGSVYDNPKLAKTAKAIERRIEKMDKVEKPTGPGKRLHFRLLTKPSRGTIALDVKDYSKKYDNFPTLLSDVSFLISQGERVAFVGNNGTGKSSMIKDIVREGQWENSVLRVGKSVTLGYYAQLGETLDVSASLIDEAMRLTGLLRGNAADVLHRFLFTRDDLEKPVKVLSGGEKARLQLAALVTSGADMLLLDEPTNHLDIPSRETVEDALEEFPGTLVVVSHDRYFLDKLADRVIHFIPPNVVSYEGNFSEFWEKWKEVALESAVVSAPAVTSDVQTRKNKSAKDDSNISQSRRIKFHPGRFRELEAEIKRLEVLRPEIDEEWRKLTGKSKFERAAKRRRRLDEIDRRLEVLYEEWVTLGERKKKW